jgi:organic radical activating enzyme
MNKPVLPFVETMITQVCNLSCAGCTNYSDLQHEGFVSWQQGKAWLVPWLERVEIPDFGIIGGEPTINPEVIDWVVGLRELMPNAQIRFTTNGILLKKKFELVRHLAEIGNCVFKIAVHREDPEIEETIQKIFDSYDWQPVTEYGIDRFKTANDFRFYVKRPDIFWKTFKGPYHDMRPHDSNPADAFSICCQQTCPLLHQGRIYKCSTNGLLAETLEKFDNPNWEQWAPFISSGIGPECTEDELAKFLNNFGKPHSICKMCPTESDIESKIIHLENVGTRKIKWS